MTLIVESGPPASLSVQDDGPGIPAEERSRIFERFYRVQHGNGEGCGLGLSIVEQIARLHQATVTVTSGADERGSRFTIAFKEEDFKQDDRLVAAPATTEALPKRTALFPDASETSNMSSGSS